MHDRDWARDRSGGGPFWQDWPMPVRILAVLIVGLVVAALVLRNYRSGPGAYYEESGDFGPVMMALATEDDAALVAMVREDPTLLGKPISGFDDSPTLFDLLVQQRRGDLLVRLIEAGELLGQADAQGRTWLHRVARLGRTELIAALIERGAAVDAVDALGFTPLFDAAMLKDDAGLPAVEVLLAHGARPGAVSVDGQTPFSIAEAAGNFRVLARLRQGANP